MEKMIKEMISYYNMKIAEVKGQRKYFQKHNQSKSSDYR